MITASVATTNEERLWIALIHPDIPQNTGNIARLSVVSGCRLVLVRPLGFRLSDRFLERSAMDYWKRLSPLVLDSLDDFESWAANRRVFCLSSKAVESLYDSQFRQYDVLCLGSESHGLPEMRRAPERKFIRIPMKAGERCLNVATAAGIAVFEALRQIERWGS